jgi:FtsZ-interacting cell division protein YlmF
MSGVEEEDAREVVEVAPARGALGGAAAGSGMAGPQQLEGLRGREWQQEQQEPQQEQEQEQEQQQEEQQQEQERQQEQQRPSAAERVASGILLGGCVLAGLVRLASGSASAAVARYAEARMAAADRAEPPARVSPHMQQG